MASRLKPGDILFADLPSAGPHPVVVILDLEDRGYVVINGTSSPTLAPVICQLSPAAAQRSGLSKPTGFYRDPKYVWYWSPPSTSAVVGRLLPGHFADLREATLAIVRDMPRPAAELGKIPVSAGLTFAEIATLKARL